MKNTKSILISALLLLCGFLFSSFSSAAAQSTKVATPTAPDGLVANLYKQHKLRSPFFQTKSRALLDRFFDPSLANLLWTDAVSAKGEVGAIDGDPLYNAQDMEIKHFAIHPPTLANNQAEVIVSFENFAEKHQITFVLARGKNGWRITNIKYDDGTDLLGILKKGNAAS